MIPFHSALARRGLVVALGFGAVLLAASAALLLASALAAVMIHPATLYSAHEFLEFLIQ